MPRAVRNIGGVEALTPGVGAIQRRTIPSGGFDTPNEAAAGDQVEAANMVGGNPVTPFLAGLGMFTILVFARRNFVPSGTALTPPIDFVLGALGTILAIVAAKVLFNSFPLPGVTPLVNAI